MTYDFAGRVALVTGGASGVGRATALLFGRSGACVVVADRTIDGAESVAATLRDEGAEAVAVHVDVAQKASCEALVDAVRHRFGRLDHAFNNAGIIETMPPPETHDVPLRLWEDVVGTDLNGVFFCLQHELALMLETGGSIVNTASLQGHISFPRTASYTAAKHGVVGLTKTVAKEYGCRGIRCNAVSPGIIRTPLNAAVLEMSEYRDTVAAPIPLGRVGRPEEVANAVLWLCSPAASYVNGAVLPVDSGFLA